MYLIDIIENKLFHSFELIGQSPSILKVKKIIDSYNKNGIRK